MVYPSKNIRIWYHNVCWHRSRTLPDSLEVGGNEEKMEKPTHGLTIVCLYLICDLDNHICGWGTRCHVGLCQPPLKISFLLINEHWTPKLAKQYPLSIVFHHLGEGENLLIHYCSWGDHSKVTYYYEFLRAKRYDSLQKGLIKVGSVSHQSPTCDVGGSGGKKEFEACLLPL